jgi:mRNA interferase YafQ
VPLSPVELSKFVRQFKKLPRKVQCAVEDQIEFLLDTPLAGEKKTGDLFFIRVHKFKVGNQLYLLAYEPDFSKSTLDLYAVGTHENFYRDLKKYKPYI